MMKIGFSMLVSLLLLAMPAIAADQPKIETLDIGDTAPDFKLKGVDGDVHTLGEYDEDVLVIIFTCNHCPTAQAYEERMKQMVEDYKNKSVDIIAISPNDPKAVRLDELGYTDLGDSYEDMKIRADHKNFNFPYLYDGDTQEVSKKYGPTATPHAFVFDKERKLRYRGRIDDSEKSVEEVDSPDLRNAIDALLNGKEVPVKTTKPFGCSIKWAYKRGSVKESFAKWAAEEVTLEPIDAEGIQEIIANDSDDVRLVNVWASWCGPCIVEFPELVTINRMYRHRNFEFITISADDPDRKDKVLSFLKKNEGSATNYIFNSDDKEKLVEAVGEEWNAALPHTLLIKPGGEVVYRHTGIIDPLEVKRKIVDALGPR